MCGIGAILDPAGTLGEPRGGGHARRAAAPRAGRRGLRSLGAAALAHTRLAIIDRGRRRPAAGSEDGAVIAVVNGEIYNHERAPGRARAPGAPLRDRLRQRGGGARLRGARARFRAAAERDLRLRAVGPRATRRLVAARDQFGVKPLYWWSDGRRVAVASEVGALIRAGPRPPGGGPRWPSTTSWPVASCPLRARCSRACRSCRRRRCSRWSEGEQPRVTSFREAPGEPR